MECLYFSRMGKTKSIILFFLIAATSLGASNPKHELKLNDVRNSMEAMFSYHVETREITATLIKRSFKNFIEQFDAQKIYFTQSELKPFSDLSSSQIEQIIDHYFADRFPEFEAVNQSIVQAIDRARAWRLEFYTDFVQQGESLKADFPSDQPLQSSSNTQDLRKRLRARLLQLCKLENKDNDPHYWSQDRRQKICTLFEKRFVRHESTYITTEREHDLALHILKAMSRGLDAHTAYFSPQEAFEMRASLEKQFEGVGVVLREGLDGIEITGLIKGGPAEKSGQVQVGDVLIEVDEHPVSDNISYQEVLERLKGNGHKEVTLGLKRNLNQTTEALVKVNLKREKILLENERLIYKTEPFGDGIIGKMTLPSFYESPDASSCDTDIREALRQMKKQGKLLGLVLDMRDNLGGFLSQAVKVASTFMTSGVVVVSKYAQGEIQYLRNVDPRVYYDGPLVILTSKMSASAAEIVAQALQDYGIGLVVGDPRTYGKGSIQYQTVTDPSAISYFKVTVGRYYTVSGRSTQITGVEADIHVPTTYAPYNIGERYLEYPLKNDQIKPAYIDSLADVQGSTKPWFQKNYLPFLQKKESRWTQMLPILQQNSQYRLDHNPNFQVFLKQMDEPAQNTTTTIDLQMQEAVNIVKDMISINTYE